MTIRRLGRLLSVVAIGLVGVSFYIKPDTTVLTCISHGAPSEIITACTTLIENPDTKSDDLTVFLDKRAWAARRIDDYELAMADITRAVGLRPDIPLLWVAKAFINNAQGALDAADADFEQALALEPENLFTIMDRAVILTGRGAYAAALRDYQRASEIDPNSKRAVNGIIRSARGMKLYDLALGWLIKAVQQWPDDADFMRALGEIQYLYAEDYQAALESFEAAAALEPEHELNLIFLGATNLKLGRIDLGKSYIERHAKQMAQKGKDGSLYWRAIALAANLTRIAGNNEFYFRGVSYALADQPEFARIEFDNYLESGGRNAMLIMRSLLGKYLTCTLTECERSEGKDYEQALTRYLEATGRVFSLESY